MLKYLICFLFLSNCIIAQTEIDTTQKRIRIVEFNFGYQIPGKDLKERFGGFNTLGAGYSLLLKNNFQIEGTGNILFGKNVNEDVLVGLRDSNGLIIGSNGTDAMIFLRMRGIHLKLMAGKVFSTSSKTRSGIKVMGGIGLLQHRIRIQDDSRAVSQVTGDYLYGYDRKASGLSLNQFIGYQYIGNNKRLNFYTGFDFSQGLTKNVRDFNFGTSEIEEDRLDLIIGFKIGVMLVFYKFDKPDEIFY